MKIKGKPTIWHVIERAKRTANADKVVVCTTDQAEDDEICKIAEDAGVFVFRGSEMDKLARWLGACEALGIDYFVTADGDDLFCEPEINDLALAQLRDGSADFIQSSIVIPGAFTYGIRASALKRVCEIKDSEDTEMMWVYFTETGLFDVQELAGEVAAFARDGVRITLDYQEDFNFFATVFDALYERNPEMPLREVLAFLDGHEEVVAINAHLNESWAQNQVSKTKLLIKQEYQHLLNEDKR